ncbi:hypothetical protein [Achromobacter phage Motura]|uniref:Uncharacterized protein n=1 Tax=Achromobacter phage Motura TaxID=2591403 RepID=A0A514CT48_9CAUD|nr:hypothetical protein H1O15_gp093 [Achromobacter phage Motura]QDH83657.1 hypothetical protein [Achromobacter phage Motura]
MTIDTKRILEIAANPNTCPISPFWLNDEVRITDVRIATIAFARAIEAEVRANMLKTMNATAKLTSALREQRLEESLQAERDGHQSKT